MEFSRDFVLRDAKINYGVKVINCEPVSFTRLENFALTEANTLYIGVLGIGLTSANALEITCATPHNGYATGGVAGDLFVYGGACIAFTTLAYTTAVDSLCTFAGWKITFG